MTTQPSRQCNFCMTVQFCVVFLKVKMYRKAALFCRMLALLTKKDLIFGQYLRHPVFAHSVAHMLKRERSYHASTRHML